MDMSLNTTRSILQTDTELLIQLPNPHASIISNHAHETLSHIPDIIVIVKQFDVTFYRLGGRIAIDD